MTSFANIAITTELAQVNLHIRNDFKWSGIWSLYERFLILNEVKTSLMLTFSSQNSSQSFYSLLLNWYDRLLIFSNLK